MKPLAVILVIFCLFPAAFNAQDGRTSVCPTISVIGPNGIRMPGESLRYSGELKGPIPSNLQFKWRVDKGEIVDGQGTLAITTLYKNITDPGVGITASLEVIGLPDGCPNFASETYGFSIDPRPIVVDEFTIPVTKIDKKRLDHLFSKRSNHDYVYIIEYFPPKTSQRTIDRKLRLTSDYLTLRKKIPRSEFKILTGRDSPLRTKYYLVPPGSINNPTP